MEIQKKEIIIKTKRKKIDDSKNGDYFTFCRNKQCNQPLYKNRSNSDTRYCIECLQERNNMTKHKKYQYLYLEEKLKQRWREYHLTVNKFKIKNDFYTDQIEKRLLHLSNWLFIINNKYKYN